MPASYDPPRTQSSPRLPDVMSRAALVLSIIALVGVLVLGALVAVLLARGPSVPTSVSEQAVSPSSTPSADSDRPSDDLRREFIAEVRQNPAFGGSGDTSLVDFGVATCAQLDARPFAITFDDIVMMGENGGRSAEAVDHITGVSVRVLCPRHLEIMEQYLGRK
jgi:hypothetical protein